MGVVLAVDGGNTKTVAVVAGRDASVRGAARGGPSDIYGTGSVEAGAAELTTVVATALARSGVGVDQIDAAVFSLAGADWPEDHDVLAAEITSRLGIEHPLVVNDALGGLRAGAPGWEGIAVICGTFNAVGARHADGRVFHLGFWPDRTGAYDLSVAALKAVYRHGIGTGPATELTRRALEMYGVGGEIELLHYFTRRGRPGVDQLVRMAPVLLDVADAGDEVARAIVLDAGRVLGEEAAVSAQRVGLPLEGAAVVLGGGVMSHPSVLLEREVMARLPGATAIRLRVPPIVGAVLIALDQVAPDVARLLDRDTLATDIATALAPPQ